MPRERSPGRTGARSRSGTPTASSSGSTTRSCPGSASASSLAACSRRSTTSAACGARSRARTSTAPSCRIRSAASAPSPNSRTTDGRSRTSTCAVPAAIPARESRWARAAMPRRRSAAISSSPSRERRSRRCEEASSHGRADPERDRSACLRSLRRVLPRAHRPARVPAAGRRVDGRRRVRAGHGRGAVAPLRARPDDLLHRPAHQGQVRDLPVSGRHLRHDARVPRAAEWAWAVRHRPGDPREPRAQSIHRGRRSSRRDRRVPGSGPRRALPGWWLPGQRRRRPHAPGRPRPGQAAHGHGEQRAFLEIARALHRQARGHGVLLGRRHDQLPGGHARRRSERGRPVLWRRRRDGARAGHQGSAHDPVRRDRRAHQRDVAGLRDGAEGERRPVRDAHVPRHPARLPQQLDAALSRTVGQAGLGAHDRVLQEASRLSSRRPEEDTPMDTANISRRRFLGAASALAGATALAPVIARAQTPSGLGEPRSVITNPPRDYSPGAPPVTYVDPDVITVDPAFNGLRQGNTPILRLWTGSLWAEGPAWSSQGRYLVWSDIPNNRQLRWLDDDGRVTVFRAPSNNSNGNTFDFQGRQLSCEHLTRRVVRYDNDGSITVIADRYDGKRLNSPNDVVPHPDGSYWFTDPPYGGQLYEGAPDAAGGPSNRAGRLKPRLGQAAGLGNDKRELPTNVDRVDPSGKVDLVVSESQVPDPNGLTFSPDFKKLYVVSTGRGPGDTGPGGKGDMHVFDVGADNKLSNQKLFSDFMVDGVKCGPDGVRCDVDGNLWCSSNAGRAVGYSGVTVWTPEGKLIGRIRLPEVCGNVCFGGPKRNRLFMAASQSLYAVYVATQGAAAG